MNKKASVKSIIMKVIIAVILASIAIGIELIREGQAVLDIKWLLTSQFLLIVLVVFIALILPRSWLGKPKPSILAPVR